MFRHARGAVPGGHSRTASAALGAGVSGLSIRWSRRPAREYRFDSDRGLVGYLGLAQSHAGAAKPPAPAVGFAAGLVGPTPPGGERLPQSAPESGGGDRAA